MPFVGWKHNSIVAETSTLSRLACRIAGSSHGQQSRSGAASSPKAATAALNALVALLCATISSAGQSGDAGTQGDCGVDATLEALQALSMKVHAGDGSQSKSPEPSGRLGCLQGLSGVD